MAFIVQSLIHTVQISLSAYSLYLDFISIRNLQGYEEKSKKAAEWSNTAAHQLHKTRTTQASGTGAVRINLFNFQSECFCDVLHHVLSLSHLPHLHVPRIPPSENVEFIRLKYKQRLTLSLLLRSSSPSPAP